MDSLFISVRPNFFLRRYSGPIFFCGLSKKTSIILQFVISQWMHSLTHLNGVCNVGKITIISMCLKRREILRNIIYYQGLLTSPDFTHMRSIYIEAVWTVPYKGKHNGHWSIMYQKIFGVVRCAHASLQVQQT